MKVLSFLEIDFRTDKYNETYLSIMKVLSELNWNGNIKQFYSQPFKPELITELFDGWEEKEIGTGIYYHKFGNINTIETWWEYHIYDKEEDYGVSICELFIPRTLEDFINDCQRAGIELEWKTNIGKEPKEDYNEQTK